jgi:biopolymer transport protein TolR
MRRPRKSINQINVVPYIDVMLVLLVIFMITAPLITPGEITLPSVGSVLTTPVTPMQIQIRRDGSLWLKESNASAIRLDRDELIARIQAKQKQAPELPVVISADKDVRYESVVEVLDMLQRNKVSKVGLLARRQPG